METSIFLAKVIGLFGAASTGVIMLRYKQHLELEQLAAKNPALAHVSGFLIIAIGTLLIVSHSVWTWDWRLVITVIAWLIFLKGLIRVLFPNMVARLMEKKSGNRKFFFTEMASFIVSAYLLYHGFFVSS